MKPTKHILLTIALLLCSIAASAHDFKVGGIYYNITSSTTVEVTYQGDSYSSYSNEYSGAVIIPATITYGGMVYNVTSIGEYAFYACKNLTSITIPESVTSIGKRAFGSCSSLTSITLPEDVTSIGWGAFENCSSLTAINIPERVTSIGDWAFQYCSSLTSINIPESMTSIGYGAFKDCSSLTAVHISSIEAWCKIAFDNYESNPLYGAHNLYLDGELVTELVIPESVTSIGSRTFYNCSSLTAINIPEGVTSIEQETFWGCSSLTAIILPESVTSIGGCAFYGCSSLTAIILPESLTSIGYSAFECCNNLTAINIPESVTSIEYYAFYYCSNLTTINIPEGVTSIEGWVFQGCSSLTSITIPESVTSIGESAFYGCSGLTVVALPKSLSAIKRKAFYGCNSLENVIIPENVEFIYQEAFAECWALESIKVLATEPPFAYDNTFSNYDIELCVPEEAMEAYRTTAPWSNFTTIRNLEGEEVEVKQCAAPVISYVNGQVVLTCETEGVTFVSETTASGIAQRQVATFDLTATYTITAYATKEDYLNSDVTTVTLCWVPCTEEHVGEDNDDESGILSIPAKPVLIHTQGGVITLSGLAEGTAVVVYDLDGTQLGTATVTGGTATITTNLAAGSVAVVQIGERSVKVAIK